MNASRVVGAMLSVLSVLPVSASAADEPGRIGSMASVAPGGGMLVQLTLGLVVVLALAVGLSWLLRRYAIPRDEVIVLPIGNSSAENLAAWFGRTLRERMRRVWPELAVSELSIGVEETPGQRGIWTLRE